MRAIDNTQRIGQQRQAGDKIWTAGAVTDNEGRIRERR
jgi:hypothetical protein